MYVHNSFNSNIALYSNEVKDYLQNGNVIHTDCKIIEEEKNHFVFVGCFDFKTNYSSSTLGNVSYGGSLKFHYQKGTGKFLLMSYLML